MASPTPSPALSSPTPLPLLALPPPRRGLPPPCWSHDETLALIDSYRLKWHSLRCANLRAADWEDVAADLSRRSSLLPSATPKTSVQCRHKIEKLRKRFRSDRLRSLTLRPRTPPSSSWPFFSFMESLENPPNASPPNSYGADDSRSIHHRFVPNGEGLRFTIPKAVRSKIVKPSSGGGKVKAGFCDAGVKPAMEEMRRRLERKRKQEMEEGTVRGMVAALRMVGDGFMRMERVKMDMVRETERMRMEMELKRTEMILDSQHRIVDAFVQGFVGGGKRKKVGRMAGQFAKPRSEPFETIDGVKLPSYQGDNINNDAFNEEARRPDPKRLIRAYSQSAATLNLLRAFSTGGYASIQRVTQWNLDFVEHSEQGDRYMELAQRVDDAIGFMVAAGLTADHPIMTSTEFWTSHECLHLPYEQALTREDSTTGRYYDCSAHMLWVGERTRQLDGAHVEFLRGVSNPLGIKVSDKMDPSELVKLCEILNPHNKPGRLTIIVRMGAKNMRIKLPHLIRAVRQAGLIVTWVSDPMHGNTMKAPCGLKTRSFDAIRSELRAFFDIHEQEGSHPSGVHLEMTGQNVTECVGGSKTVTFADLSSRYHTHCDPRLNASQSLELAFSIADWLRKRRALSWNDWVFDEQQSTAVV